MARKKNCWDYYLTAEESQIQILFEAIIICKCFRNNFVFCGLHSFEMYCPFCVCLETVFYLTSIQFIILQAKFIKLVYF